VNDSVPCPAASLPLRANLRISVARHHHGTHVTERFCAAGIMQRRSAVKATPSHLPDARSLGTLDRIHADRHREELDSITLTQTGRESRFVWWVGCWRALLSDAGSVVLEVAAHTEAQPGREKQNVGEGWTFLHFVLTGARKRFHVQLTSRSHEVHGKGGSSRGINILSCAVHALLNPLQRFVCPWPRSSSRAVHDLNGQLHWFV